jgi:hypothetical protein
MSESFYKHAVTGEIALLNDRFAAVFGDTLTRVDSHEDTAPKRTTKKQTASDDNTDSPKEGND